MQFTLQTQTRYSFGSGPNIGHRNDMVWEQKLEASRRGFEHCSPMVGKRSRTFFSHALQQVPLGSDAALKKLEKMLEPHVRQLA